MRLSSREVKSMKCSNEISWRGNDNDYDKQMFEQDKPISTNGTVIKGVL